MSRKPKIPTPQLTKTEAWRCSVSERPLLSDWHRPKGANYKEKTSRYVLLACTNYLHLIVSRYVQREYDNGLTCEAWESPRGEMMGTVDRLWMDLPIMPSMKKFRIDSYEAQTDQE